MFMNEWYDNKTNITTFTDKANDFMAAHSCSKDSIPIGPSCEGFLYLVRAGYEAARNLDCITNEPMPVEIGFSPEVIGLAYDVMQRALSYPDGVRVFWPNPLACAPLQQGYVASHGDLHMFLSENGVNIDFKEIAAFPVYLVLVSSCFLVRKFIRNFGPDYDKVYDTASFLNACVQPCIRGLGVHVSYGEIELEILRAINWRITRPQPPIPACTSPLSADSVTSMYDDNM